MSITSSLVSAVISYADDVPCVSISYVIREHQPRFIESLGGHLFWAFLSSLLGHLVPVCLLVHWIFLGFCRHLLGCMSTSAVRIQYLGLYSWYCRENSPSSPLIIEHSPSVPDLAYAHNHTYTGLHGPQLTVDRSYTTSLGSAPRCPQLLITSLSVSPISWPTHGHSRGRLTATRGLWHSVTPEGRPNSSASDTQRHGFSTQNTRRCHGRSCGLLHYAPWHL